jgi:hypothetical protein
MKSLPYMIPVLFPIAAALFVWKFARGDQSLGSLFLLVAIVSGGAVGASLLYKAVNQSDGAKLTVYMLGAVLGTAIAVIVSVIIAFLTILFLPGGRV